MASLHNRMPVILPRDAYAQWVDPNPRLPADLKELLIPYPTEEMESHSVSTLVNSPNNDRADCILLA